MRIPSLSRWMAIGGLLAAPVAATAAQCPDGSPPPCGGAPTTRAGRETSNLPDSMRLVFGRAVEEHRRRTLEGAEEALRLVVRVIAFDSNHAPAWTALARTSQQGWIRGWTLDGRGPDSLLALAVRASRRAVQLDSALAPAWVVYGRVAGSVDAADRRATRRALERALVIEPRNVDALFELGLMELELLRPARAENAWRRALGISPTHLESLAFMAIHLQWSGDYARARRFVDSALTIDPSYAVAREAAAEIALDQRRWADAERHVDIGRRGGGGQEATIAYTVLARAAAARGDSTAATRHILEAERLADSTRPTRHQSVFLGAAWAQLGDTARALRWLGAYTPREDLHFQLHLKREPGLRWLVRDRSSLLAPDP